MPLNPNCARENECPLKQAYVELLMSQVEFLRYIQDKDSYSYTAISNKRDELKSKLQEMARNG